MLCFIRSTGSDGCNFITFFVSYMYLCTVIVMWLLLNIDIMICVFNFARIAPVFSTFLYCVFYHALHRNNGLCAFLLQICRQFTVSHLIFYDLCRQFTVSHLIFYDLCRQFTVSHLIFYDLCRQFTVSHLIFYDLCRQFTVSHQKIFNLCRQFSVSHLVFQ